MQIVAVKPIYEGDEITVSYGEDYFGDNNEECLCSTCESLQQNGWAPQRRVEQDEEEEIEGDAVATLEQAEDTIATDESVSLKRPRDESDGEASRDTTPTSKRARFEQKSPDSEADLLRKTTLKKAHSTSSLRQEVPVSSIEDPSINLAPQMTREIRNQQRDGLLMVKVDETTPSREVSPQSSIAAASPKSSQSTDATSIEEDLESSASKEKVDAETTHEAHPSVGVATVKTEVTTMVNAPWPSPPADDDAYMSDLSELSSSLEFDSENEQIVKRKPHACTLRTTRSKSRFEVQNRVGTPITLCDGDESAYTDNPRKPGDYMTSHSLLSAKYSKWVNCHTCDADFIQQDGYNTRKECPRCERHSKLYGFPWPKTEKEGKHDREERIRDHRTVHRFVDPNEERQLKRDKVKKVIKNTILDRYSTPRSLRLGSGSVEIESAKKMKKRKAGARARKTM